MNHLCFYRGNANLINEALTRQKAKGNIKIGDQFNWDKVRIPLDRSLTAQNQGSPAARFPWEDRGLRRTLVSGLTRRQRTARG
jgi:hypothetical protein